MFGYRGCVYQKIMKLEFLTEHIHSVNNGHLHGGGGAKIPPHLCQIRGSAASRAILCGEKYKGFSKFIKKYKF